MGERWKYIKETASKYLISNHGRSAIEYSNGRRKVRNYSALISGYRILRYTDELDKKTKYLYIHRLVAHYFIKKHPLDSYRNCINHIDGNKLNNHHENLEWVTLSENMKHARMIGTLNTIGSNNCMAKLSDAQVFAIKYKFIGFENKELAQIFNVSHSTISGILAGNRWKHI